MTRRKTRKIPLTKEEAIAEAKRFLKNAKEILSRADVKYGKIYEDTKIVREAAGIAYLAALKAIDGYLLGKGTEPEKLPISINEYFKAVSKIPRNGKLLANLRVVYENLHIFAYYRGGVSVDMIKAGIKSVEEIIKMLE
ncbi:DUF5618 family protein [Candidatus Chrysopegis kryptomonas]|uniref:DUF5618 domain-containing protein n=1 Tax=Candidatus Chryseopegocella kryptomonas TaxID=1633643 RepID=A0A0P1P080_9BACT|nr:DUF5618 family protein [Candidatus Chrysopegis kryptomonas]CUT05154.1 hypothetical protein JGI23_01895 [Candidatus Chrysopegis kryptomonas]